MSCLLDAQVLRKRPYSGPAACSAFQTFIAKPTEERRLTAWEKALPLASIEYARRTWDHEDLSLADDVLGMMAWQLYRQLPRIPAKVDLPPTYTCYLGKVLRREFYASIAYLERGCVQMLPEELAAVFASRSRHREEGSIRDVENRIYLSELPAALEKRLSKKCRFGDRFRRASLHVARRLFTHREPSPGMLRTVWGVDAELVIGWTLVTLRGFLCNQRDRQIVEGSELEFILA